MTLKHLSRVFEGSAAVRGQTLPIRKTRHGTWVPTPMPVIESAVRALIQMGCLGPDAPPGHLIDAGAGDGRVSAVLATLDPTRVVYGIEADPILYAQAVANLQTLESGGAIDRDRVCLIEADYCDPATYEARGIALNETHMVFNYPDGNERRLATFVSERAGHATQFCLLAHNRTLELGELQLRERREVAVAHEPTWQLALYERSS